LRTRAYNNLAAFGYRDYSPVGMGAGHGGDHRCDDVASPLKAAPRISGYQFTVGYAEAQSLAYPVPRMLMFIAERAHGAHLDRLSLRCRRRPSA
jgi:hypothetical protein